MTGLSIVKDGRLTIPLFHGTSSRFYDSIRSTGLGGRNIVEEMGIRNAARLLIEQGSGSFQSDDWIGDVHACMHIAADPAKHVVGFLRYGGTYMSPSRESAANYALHYPAGGEALTHILRLHRLLSAINPELATRQEFAGLVELVASPVIPILVEARDVEISGLRSERGGNIEDILTTIEMFLGDEVYDSMVGQENFELTQPIHPEQLRFYKSRKLWNSTATADRAKFSNSRRLIRSARRAGWERRSSFRKSIKWNQTGSRAAAQDTRSHTASSEISAFQAANRTKCAVNLLIVSGLQESRRLHNPSTSQHNPSNIQGLGAPS